MSLLVGFKQIGLNLIRYMYPTSATMSGTIYLTGLTAAVTIRRDQYGVPHIEGSQADVYFALGFVHAQDRLWQMEYFRRIAQGRLSEIFGKKTLVTDKFFRTLGLSRCAQASWSVLNVETQKILDAYANGVNAFIKTQSLPLQFKLLKYAPDAWHAVDCLSLQKLQAFSLSNNLNLQWENQQLVEKWGIEKLAQLRQAYSSEWLTTLSDNDLQQSNLFKKPMLATHPEINSVAFPDGACPVNSTHGRGSNAWVVNANKSLTGKPLLANDMHLSLQAPENFYLVELKYADNHIVGASIPGLPNVFSGHNHAIAWGVTVARVETADLVIIEDAVNVCHKRTETILIKRNKPINIEIMESEAGPLLNKWLSPVPDKKFGVAIKSTVLRNDDTTVQGVFELNHAHDWQAFRAATTKIVAPALNMIFADTAGNIGYQLVGKVPLRTTYSQILLPIKLNSVDDWQTCIPFDELPFVYNPGANFIVTANNKIVSDNYLYCLTRYWEAPGYRINKITSTLVEKEKLSFVDMLELQLNTDNTIWTALKSELLKTIPLNQSSEEALSVLQAWDGNADINSRGMPIFAYWYRELTALTDDLKMGNTWDQSTFILEQLRGDAYFCQQKYASSADYLSKTLKVATRKLNKKLSWGQIHQAIFNECGLGYTWLSWIWKQKIPASGADEAINVSGVDTVSLAKVYGASYRQVIDLANFNNNQYIIPLGQSDDPFSPHHADLLFLWQKGQYISIDNAISEKDKILILKSI